MREIKFRAWLIKDKVYADVDVLVLHQGLVYISFNEKQVNMCGIDKLNEISMIQKVDDVILEQYTGMKDKNGKEIYEGDILSFVYRPTRETKENYRGVIEFGNPNGAYNWGWQIRFIGTQPLTAKDILFWIEDIYTDCEVIGNIHENPELLKGAK